MTTTIDRPETGLGAFTLEHLDFTPELPCESPRHEASQHHDGPGELLIRSSHRCPKSTGGDRLFCRKVWAAAKVVGLHCTNCGAHASRDEWWTIVGGI